VHTSLRKKMCMVMLLLPLRHEVRFSVCFLNLSLSLFSPTLFCARAWLEPQRSLPSFQHCQRYRNGSANQRLFCRLSDHSKSHYIFYHVCSAMFSSSEEKKSWLEWLIIFFVIFLGWPEHSLDECQQHKWKTILLYFVSKFSSKNENLFRWGFM
jgi:hypothetical protein